MIFVPEVFPKIISGFLYFAAAGRRYMPLTIIDKCFFFRIGAGAIKGEKIKKKTHPKKIKK